MELEEELRVVGNNLKSLEVSEEKVHNSNPLFLKNNLHCVKKTKQIGRVSVIHWGVVM